MRYYIAHVLADGRREYLNTDGVFDPFLHQELDGDETLVLDDLEVALAVAQEHDALVLTEGVTALEVV
jgi:hypothetical protein